MSVGIHSGASSTRVRKFWLQQNYRWWFLSDTSEQLSSSIRAFAFPLIVLAVTHSAGLAASVTSVSMVACAICKIPGGAIQDRFDRRKILIVWAGSGAVLFAVGAGLIWCHRLSVVVALVLAVLLGVRGGLSSISSILLRTIVSTDRLPNAMAVRDGRDAVLEFVGAPVGGALLQLGQACPFLANTILNLLALIGAWRIKGLHQPAMSDDQSSAVKSALKGVRWAFTNQFTRVMMLAGSTIFAVFNAAVMITIFDLVRHGTVAGAAGFVNTASAVGVFLGALCVNAFIKRARGGFLVLLAFGLPVLSVCLLIPSQGLIWRIVALLPALFLLPVGNAVCGALQMMIIPDELLGRVFAGLGVVEMSLGALVTWLAGVGLDKWGYHITMIGLAAVMILLFLRVFAHKSARDIPMQPDLADYAVKLRS